MLEHHSEENSPSGYAYQQSDSETDTVFSAASSEEIEDYLDQVIAPLVRVLPRSKRKAIRTHVKAQLEASVAARRELGETQEEAVRAAIRQSGDPELISQRWVLDTRTQPSGQSQQQITLQNLPSLKPPSARAATLTALGLLGLPYLADVSTFAGKYWATHSDNTITYFRFMLFTVPLLAGFVTGLVARNRPVRGVLNALALLCIPAILLPGLLMALSYTNLLANTAALGDILGWIAWVTNPLPGISGLVPWTILGCLGAVLGKGLHTRTAKLRTRLSHRIRLHRMTRTRKGRPPLHPYESLSV
ncbi:MAG: hypothetical protein JWN14_2940 [Chthonomonadales bacterium]|nr:hypothetical protein [Chthonomonadales bacterium]